MATLKLRPSVEVFPASDGDLYLLGGAVGGDVVLRQATPVVRRLVHELEDGARTLDELAAGLASTGLTEQETVRDAVGELERAGVVQRSAVEAGDILDAVDADRYDRQLHYFADQAAGERSAAEMQLALGRASVVVLGAGGLGSWTTTRSSSATSTGRSSTGPPMSAGPRWTQPQTRSAASTRAPTS